MGYYIQTPTNKNKADFIVDNYGARIVNEIPKWSDDEAIICVIDNGPFEAAGYAYSPQELEEFASADLRDPQRVRTWLKMDKTLAKKLSGYSR